MGKITVKHKGVSCYNNSSGIEELKTIAEVQKKARDFAYFSNSGIKRLTELSKISVRDNTYKEDNVSNKIPKTFTRIAYEETSTSLKNNLNTTKKLIKSAIKKNENLSEDDKRYLFTALKHTPTLFAIINYKKVDYMSEYFFFLNVNPIRLNNLLRRYYRKYKKRSKAKSNIAIITSNLYSIRNKRIDITGLNNGKRNTFRLFTIFPKNKPTIQVSFYDDYILFHVPINQKIIKNTTSQLEAGIDLGMTDMLTLSNGNVYGANSAQTFYEFSDNLKQENKNRLWSYRNSIEKKLSITEDKEYKDKLSKILNNLIEHNLGNKKYSKKINRYKARVVSLVNSEINYFIKKENPKTIILEDLSWKENKKKKISKKQRNRFTTWTKGYILEQLENKLLANRTEVIKINPAYTSQVCYKCQRLGERNGKKFNCIEHGTIDADLNAALNIEARPKIKEITIDTNYELVKQYYLNLEINKN